MNFEGQMPSDLSRVSASDLLDLLRRLERTASHVQLQLQKVARLQMEADRQAFEDKIVGRENGYVVTKVATPMPLNKRYLYLTRSLYVCADGRVICSETPGELLTEAAALEGRDPGLPPSDFLLEV